MENETSSEFKRYYDEACRAIMGFSCEQLYPHQIEFLDQIRRTDRPDMPLIASWGYRKGKTAAMAILCLAANRNGDTAVFLTKDTYRKQKIKQLYPCLAEHVETQQRGTRMPPGLRILILDDYSGFSMMKNVLPLLYDMDGVRLVMTDRPGMPMCA
jgi:hypothetical protein